VSVMLLLLQSILNNYSDDEILQMCKTINKDYNIYDPEDVRWAKIGYVLNKQIVAILNCCEKLVCQIK